MRLVNIAPTKMEDLLEVITHCEYHPVDHSVYLYSSSRGYFTLKDLRANESSVKFDCTDSETLDNKYSEIISSVSYASF